MANSIDFGAVCLGAALGYGLRNELKSAGSVCKNALLAAATVAATTTVAAVEEAKKTKSPSPEEQAAKETFQRIDQQIAGQAAGNGKNG